MSLNRSILATALTGASGAGGTLIYHHAVPWTWQEVLIKEGCYLLNANDEYKAVWSEHKTSLKNIEDLKSHEETFNKESIQNWCGSQLKNNYSRNSTSYTNISNLCTHRGITTVKAKLILSGYGDFIIDETVKEESKETGIINLYKAVFGIYRYYDKFIDWVKKYNKENLGSEEIELGSKVATGYIALKSACETELNRPYKEVSDTNHYTHLYWWCKKLPYTTVEDLVKERDKDWELAEEWDGKADKWRYTKEIYERYGKGDDIQSKYKSIEDNKFEGWCDNLKKQNLSDNAAYRDMYLIVRYVCRKEKPKSKRVSK